MKKETILVTIIFIGLIAHYVLGYGFFHLETQKIYKVTICFSLDIWGLVLFIITRDNRFKLLGTLAMVLGTTFMYREFADTSYRSMVIAGISLINLFFSLYYVDTFKDLKK